jgi:cysteine desulfurase
MKRVYFDNAATTALRPEVAQLMADTLKDVFGNPSSTHAYGRESKAIVEDSRKKIAALIGAEPSEIIFTSGGTEADNLALQACVRDLGIERVISSRIEHHAVLHTLEEMRDQFSLRIAYLDTDPCGRIDYEQLEELLANDTAPTLVSLMHVNNEIGNVLDIERVARICAEHKAYFHSDMVQSVGHFNVDFKTTAVHFAAAAAHKFHGPKGVGFTFVRKNSGIKPLIFGGSQERGLRAGTEAVYAIAGMAKALEMAYENLEQERAYVLSIKEYFKEELRKAIPGVRFNGACDRNDESTYTLLNACLPFSPEKSMMLLFQLDLKGIACSQGSACQSGSAAGSHVLNELLSEEDRQKPSVRFSFSKYNNREEVDYVIGVLKEFARNP